jgi:membrane-associated protease RseP (regulator of RpoE activity)
MDLTPFLVAWRHTALLDREVVDALIDPAHAAPSPELTAALASWPGSYYWSDEGDGRHLILTRPAAVRRRERWALHVTLLALTIVTTTLAGAILAGAIPYDPNPLRLLRGMPAAGLLAWSRGLPFSLPLLAILLAHELGHYITARRYHLDASPPYFIPVPLFPSFVGTMGAFIRLRTVVSDRRQLFDVGVAGPIAGFVVALPVLAVGLALSTPLPVHHFGGMILAFGREPQAPLGDSLLTWALRHAVLGSVAGVRLHPVAFAGWVGMFVTMLNLLPLAQLDGGHVLYAVAPGWHERAARGFVLVTAVLGAWWWGWWVWVLLVMALSRGRLGHPQVLDPRRPLPPSRRRLAWAALALFVVTFAPVPFPL